MAYTITYDRDALADMKRLAKKDRIWVQANRNRLGNLGDCQVQ